jgi:nucleotidyltransferase/DNA polymerase involved in DNA repair
MRIACLHLPAFPLQVLVRTAPHRRGDAIAVVARAGLAPAVVACSRAARAAGVAVGMAAATVREVAPGVELVTADPAAERAAAKAIAEALLALSPRVDPGGAAPEGAHHAIFAEVPARMRGAAFGARALAVLETMGVSGRVGIADDRFSARVAATTGAADVVTVPRGGSAAFLAPLPLSLLAISGEVRHVLETLGVHTLGEFAALPPPSVARPEDADWQRLARGEGGAALAAFAPGGPIVERLEVPAGGAGAALGDAIAELAARVAARLAVRGHAAAAIELAVGGDAGAIAQPPIEIVPDAPLDGAGAIAGAIAARLGDAAGAIAWIEARVRAFASDGGAVVEPVLAEASAPPRVTDPSGAAVPAAPLTLVPEATAVLARAPHRRTRRGKERPRIARPAGAQVALFASFGAGGAGGAAAR